MRVAFPPPVAQLRKFSLERHGTPHHSRGRGARRSLCPSPPPIAARCYPQNRRRRASIRAEGDRRHTLLVAAEHADLFARRHLPQPRRLVPRAGGDGAAIRTEGDRQHTTLVAAQGDDLAARGHLPQPRGLSSEPVATVRPSGLKATDHTAPSWPRRTPISLPVATSHSRTVLSCEPVASVRPSGLKAADDTTPRGRAGRRSRGPSRHLPQPRRVVPRAGGDGAAIGAEGGGRHAISWPRKAAISCPWPPPTAARSCPKSRWRGSAIGAEGDRRHPLVAAKHDDLLARRHLPQPRGLVPEPVASVRPSGLKATEFTPPSWPRSTAISLPVATSHSRAVLSPEPVTIVRPSGLKATDYTPSWPRRTAISLPVATSHSRAVLSPSRWRGCGHRG